MSCKHGNHSEDDCDLCQAEEDAYARGVAAGRAEERERCAAICEQEICTCCWDSDALAAAEHLAAEMRKEPNVGVEPVTPATEE